MRLAQISADTLVIERRPASHLRAVAALAIGFLLTGVALAIWGSFWAALALLCGLAASLVVFLDFSAEERARFDRRAGTLTLTRRDASGLYEDVVALETLTGAQLRVIRSHDGPPMARAEVLVGDRPLRLTRAFSDGSAPARIVDNVNAWLAAD